MQELTPQQQKRLKKIAGVIADGNLAIAEYILELEDKFDSVVEEIKRNSPDLAKILETIKGKDGEDYVLTDDDRQEIADAIYGLIDNDSIAEKAKDKIDVESIAQKVADKAVSKIKVPVVEKIVEKKETIREIPVVTTITEIKEVAVADPAEVVVKKINSLPTDKEEYKIDASHLKNLPQSVQTIIERHNGFIETSIKAGDNIVVVKDAFGNWVISSTATGGTGGGSGSGIITISGTIDDSNVTFTSTSEPDILVINGGSYRPTGGAYTWSYSAGTITLSSAVGTGGNIYGMTSASAPTVCFTTPLNDGISLTSGDGVAYTTIPDQYDGWEIVEVGASRVSGTGVPSIQIHNVTQGVDILSTNITIDSGETDSSTATTQPVINSSNKTVNSFDQLRFDVDNAGTSTLWCIIRVVLQRP